MRQGAHVKEEDQSSKKSLKLSIDPETVSRFKPNIDFKNNPFKNIDVTRINPKVALGAAAVLLLCIVLIVAISSGHKSVPAAELPKADDDEALGSVMMYENNVALSETVAFTSRAYDITLADSGNEVLYIKAFETDPEMLTTVTKKISGKDAALKKAEQLVKLLTPSFFEDGEVVSDCAGSADVGRYVVNFAHTEDTAKIAVSITADGKLEAYTVMRTVDDFIMVGDTSYDPYTYCVSNAGEYLRCSELPELVEITYDPMMKFDAYFWDLTTEGEVYTENGELVLDSEYFMAPFAAFSSLEPGSYIVQMPIIRNMGRYPVMVMCFKLVVPDNSPYMPYSANEMHDIVKAENPAYPNATPIYNAADLDWFRYQLMLGKPTDMAEHKFDLPAFFTRNDGKVLIAYPSGDSSPIVYAGNTCYSYEGENSSYFNHIFEIG